MNHKKEAAQRIALKYIEALEWEEKLPPGKVTKLHEDEFKKILDAVNKKKVQNSKDFYDLLEDVGIDKHMLRDLVARVVRKGDSEEVVKMVFLLGEGKPLGDNSPSKGLKILTEDWVKGQLDDSALKKRIKPKFWTLFRDKEWLDKENKDEPGRGDSWINRTKNEVDKTKEIKI